MIIKNASVFTERNCKQGSHEQDVQSVFLTKDIFMKSGYFVDETEVQGNEEVIDASDCYAIPGLIDIHFHGCLGRELCNGTVAEIEQIAGYQAKTGVTTIVPAAMTMEREQLSRICEAASAFFQLQSMGKEADKAQLCGISLEGPFLSSNRCGAQRKDLLQEPAQDFLNEMLEKSGSLIKLVSIAPEIPGAMHFIRSNAGRVIMSLAHTEADYDTAKKAFQMGAVHVTHLYNAMNPFTSRQPGVVGAAADSHATVELICDGVHLHPSVVRSTLKMMGKEKVIFISDSMMATGCKDGSYTLGGQKVNVQGKRATLTDGTIAGSVCNLMDCLRIAVLEMQIPLETAVLCASVNPAKRMGIYDSVGSITFGKRANMVLLRREDLSIKQVILNGRICYSMPSRLALC